ncbi:translesion DNA synthesis-associated protein ImuA [Cellvibrio sp. OA-2007]|uniref:translesion DNA synthesis-associated protein ImuA n=1 Tax=Cellvibrio sp. OA-2007 TaxID=529823 RepID=UPI000785F9DF|nr:translesion DNA synthesis-associated protein ImuA [Cellvibrio sp. OA-2007]
MKLIPTDPNATSLEQLLCRGDIWRGQSHQTPLRLVVNSGYAQLNDRLVGGGWPVASLIEVCQRATSHAEWQLLMPALLANQRGLVVLLNPPANPFAQALLKAGMDLERLLIVEAKDKADFLSSFIELARSDACDAVMAWQPHQALSYTELRKCALAATEGQGIYVLFRPDAVRDQSSPAVVRLSLQWQLEQLSVSIFKQKGELVADKGAIDLPLPAAWKGLLPHQQLDQQGKSKPRIASVTPIHGGRRGRR